MGKKDSPEHRFNKKVFCLYQSTSDDLMFWCWFNVLILSMTYGLDMTQISLVFTVSFWAALAMKIPGRFLVRKFGAGNSVMISAVLFLAAAIVLTFGRSLPLAIVGQSIYLIALTFQVMSVVIVKNAARSDPAGVDPVKVLAAAGTVNSVISLAAALLMSRMYRASENLPMYICIGFCVSSCILAFLVRRYDTGGAETGGETLRETLPGVKTRSFDRTTISCLFLSVLFMVIFSVAGDNLRILIEHDLFVLTDKEGTVFFFSMFLLASRIVKILSNFILYVSRKRRGNPQRSFFFIVLGVVLSSVLGYLAIWGDRYSVVILAVAAFLIRVLVFDPFRFSMYEFILKRLKDARMVDVLFVQSAGSDLFTAVFSAVSTVLLKFYGMENVMLMLFIIGIIFGAGYFIVRRNLIRIKGSRKYLKWSKEEITSSDNLMVAAAALLLHYGIVRDESYTPKKLTEKALSVEDISAANRSIQFEGFYEYNEGRLKELFYAGHPCAVRAAVHEGEPDRWLPVVYLDDDGGIVWNPYSEERFLVQLHQTSEICCFTIL